MLLSCRIIKRTNNIQNKKDKYIMQAITAKNDY